MSMEKFGVHKTEAKERTKKRQRLSLKTKVQAGRTFRDLRELRGRGLKGKFVFTAQWTTPKH